MVNILISGIFGHMGRNVAEIASADSEVCVACGVDLKKESCAARPFMTALRMFAKKSTS